MLKMTIKHYFCVVSGPLCGGSSYFVFRKSFGHFRHLNKATRKLSFINMSTFENSANFCILFIAHIFELSMPTLKTDLFPHCMCMATVLVYEQIVFKRRQHENFWPEISSGFCCENQTHSRHTLTFHSAPCRAHQFLYWKHLKLEPDRYIGWLILSADISLSKLYWFRSLLAYMLSDRCWHEKLFLQNIMQEKS